MKNKIIITAILLAFTFVARAMFEPRSGQAVTETTTARLVTATSTDKLHEKGSFEEFGGEFHLKLTLEQRGGKWTVVKTDEVTQAEVKQAEQLKAFAEGFSEPDPSTWVTVMSPVREYLYHRKQAVIQRNPEKLFTRYPDLKQGVDRVAGVNALPWTISTAKNFKPIDGNINPEYNQRLKVKLTGDRTEVIVHGMETYLYSH